MTLHSESSYQGTAYPTNEFQMTRSQGNFKNETYKSQFVISALRRARLGALERGGVPELRWG